MIYSILSSKKSFPALEQKEADWWVTHSFASTGTIFIKADTVFSKLSSKKASDGVWQGILFVSKPLFSNTLNAYAFKHKKASILK